MIFTRGSLPGTLLWVLLTFAPASGYGASLVETLGDTGSTNSFSGRLFSDGPGAAYFNPTLLLDQRKSFAAGMLYLNQSLSITLGQKNSQYNVPESIFDSMPVDPNTPAYRPLPTDLLRNPRGSHDPSTFLRYLTLGSVLSFAKGNVAFGFTAIMPLKAFQTQRPFYVDEREQYFSNSLHFELFEDRLESNVITFALAGKLTPRIWLGAGLTLNQTATSSSEIYMPDASEQEVSFLNSNVEVITTLIPHFAATLLLGEGGRLTATAHLPGESRTEGYSDIQFYNYHNQTGDEATIQKFTLVYGWEPLRVASGLSWKFGETKRNISVGGTLLWSRWSDYVDRHGETPVKPWSDTLTFTLAARGTWGIHSMGVDAQFVPTPVPLQEGRSNYVDNNRLGLGLGYSCNFTWKGQKVAAGVSTQFIYLFPRSHAKNPNDSDPLIDEFVDSKNILTDEFMAESSGFQTNNPGYPGFESRGWLMSVGIWLKVFM